MAGGALRARALRARSVGGSQLDRAGQRTRVAPNPRRRARGAARRLVRPYANRQLVRGGPHAADADAALPRRHAAKPRRARRLVRACGPERADRKAEAPFPSPRDARSRPVYGVVELDEGIAGRRLRGGCSKGDGRTPWHRLVELPRSVDAAPTPRRAVAH